MHKPFPALILYNCCSLCPKYILIRLSTCSFKNEQVSAPLITLIPSPYFLPALTLIFILFSCLLSVLPLEYKFQNRNLMGLVSPVPSTVHPVQCTCLGNLWWTNVICHCLHMWGLLSILCILNSYSSFKTQISWLLGSCGFPSPHGTFYKTW